MIDPQIALTNRIQDRRLTMVAKRTYRLRPDRAALVADEQVPVVTDASYDELGCLADDMDVVITKRGTDFVVKATAHAPGGRPVTEVDAAVTVAGVYRHRVRVIGDRTCQWRDGRLVFSEPEPFTTMPLTYDRAYGGSDESAREELDQHHLGALQKYVRQYLTDANLCVYYRNSAGKGYLIHAGEDADGLPLPNLEDPDDRLNARHLAVEDATRWYDQPLPAGFGWFDWQWFPRLAFLGLTSELGPWDELPGPDEPPIREQRMGYLPADMFHAPKPIEESFSTRALNGATPALVLPFLQSDEEVLLENMDPEHPSFRFRLPAEIPRLIVKPHDEEPRELKPQLFSVIIEKDLDRLSLVWGGSVITKYPYGPDQMGRVAHRVLW